MRILTGPLLLALALSGCAGQGADDDGIATVGGAKPDASVSAGPSEQLSDDERRLKFAECMRGQGIDMPDPDEGSGERARLRFNSDEDPEKVQAALEACKAYAPNGGEPLKLDADQLEAMHQMAKCMRANGVPDFPDPDADGRIRMQNYAGLDRDDPAFRAAIEKCRQYSPLRPSASPR